MRLMMVLIEIDGEVEIVVVVVVVVVVVDKELMRMFDELNGMVWFVEKVCWIQNALLCFD
jgi:hypothetical protein